MTDIQMGNVTGSRMDVHFLIDEKFKTFNKPKFLRWACFIFLLLFIIASIALIVVCKHFIQYKQNSKLCLTSECIRSAKNYKYSMNLSADPCDDFYKFTCGNWGQEHPNHEWFGAYSTFTTIREMQAIKLKQFFETTPSVNEPEAVKKARRLFASCIDTTTLEKIGLKDLYKNLKKLNLPIIPSLLTGEDKKGFKFDWLRTIPKLKKYLNTEILLASPVISNPFNSTNNVIFIRVPEQNMLILRFSFKKDDQVNKYTTSEFHVRTNRASMFKFFVKDVMLQNNISFPEDTLLDEAAMYINNMTDFMAKLIKKYAINKSSLSIFRGEPIITIQNQLDTILKIFTNETYPNFFEKYFEYLLEDTGEVLNTKTDLMHFFVAEQMYFSEAVAFLLNTPDIYIELFLWWMSVFSMMMQTSSRYIKESFLFAVKTPTPKWFECSELVNTDMGLAASYILANRNFDNKTKPKLERMLKELQLIFVDELNELTWMDEVTKRATLEKNDAMVSLIGYPDWLFDTKSLDKFYEKIEIQADTFLQNVINIQEQLTFSNINLLRKTNTKKWKTDPNNVNAFYLFQDNTINIPMSVAQFPFYDLGLEALNYGALGSILGHELTHGFDNTGSKHDKNGNIKPWWSFTTIGNFDSLTHCFIDQYHDIINETFKENVDGRQTLGENLADNGGLYRAFKAYSNYLEKHEEEKKLPGFEKFTSHQMFFISYSSAWCETATTESLSEALASNHGPNFIRVTVALRNSEDFSEAFKCPKGSKMNPHKKCKLL